MTKKMNAEVAKKESEIAKEKEEKVKLEASNRQLQEEVSKLKLDMKATQSSKSEEAKDVADLKRSFENELNNIKERMGSQLAESERNLKNEKNERNKLEGKLPSFIVYFFLNPLSRNK